MKQATATIYVVHKGERGEGSSIVGAYGTLPDALKGSGLDAARELECDPDDGSQRGFIDGNRVDFTEVCPVALDGIDVFLVHHAESVPGDLQAERPETGFEGVRLSRVGAVQLVERTIAAIEKEHGESLRWKNPTRDEWEANCTGGGHHVVSIKKTRARP